MANASESVFASLATGGVFLFPPSGGVGGGISVQSPCLRDGDYFSSLRLHSKL